MPVTFPNARPLVRDLVQALLLNRAEPYAAGVKVSTRDVPGDDATRPLPYVQIKVDSTARDARLDGRASIRVLVYHRDEGLSVDLAALIEALLLDASAPGIRGFTPGGSSPTGTTDPDLGIPLAFFTLTARLTPRSIERSAP